MVKGSALVSFIPNTTLPSYEESLSNTNGNNSIHRSIFKMLYFRVGCKMFIKYKRGNKSNRFAHFFEELLFAGTENVNDDHMLE